MEDTAAAWRGRVLRAWRESAGLTQADLATRLFVTPQAVSNWERGITGDMVIGERLIAVLRLSGDTADALTGTLAVAAQIARQPRSSWSWNFAPPSRPIWAWIRTPPGSQINVAFRWGSPFRGVYDKELPPGGLFVTAPSSIPNPPVEVLLAEPGWVSFGTGIIPASVMAALKADHAEGVTLVDAAARVEDALEPGWSGWAALNQWLSPIRSLAESLGIQWAIVAPHFGFARDDQTPIPVDGAELGALSTAGPSALDDRGRLVTQLALPLDQIRSLRETVGMSLRVAAAAATSLDPQHPVSAKHVEALESGQLPTQPRLLPRLDLVYAADGRLGIERTYDARHVSRQHTSHVVAFPTYWTGPIWIQPLAPSPDDQGLIELEWGPWQRRQPLRSGIICTTRKAITAGPGLHVTVPTGWTLVAGTGLPTNGLDINHGWKPRSVRAAISLLREGAGAVHRGRKAQLPLGPAQLGSTKSG